MFIEEIKEIIYPDSEKIKDFRYLSPGVHGPLLAGHDPEWHLLPIVASLGYLVCTFLGEWLMKKYDIKYFLYGTPAYVLKWVAFFHNLMLSFFSLFVFLALGYDLLDKWYREGTELMLCDSHYTSSQGRVVWWYYLFYLSKFYEFLDTALLIVKRKPVIFLHRYHHFITLIFAYVNLSAEIGMQWIVIITNLFVHIPMYAYYAATTLGFTPSWKSLITKTQIIQFVFDAIMAVVTGSYKYWLRYPCAGSNLLWAFDVAIILSFLFLFIRFHSTNYPSTSSTPKRD